jgi:hypothetical protein
VDPSPCSGGGQEGAADAGEPAKPTTSGRLFAVAEPARMCLAVWDACPGGEPGQETAAAFCLDDLMELITYHHHQPQPQLPPPVSAPAPFLLAG